MLGIVLRGKLNSVSNECPLDTNVDCKGEGTLSNNKKKKVVNETNQMKKKLPCIKSCFNKS